MFPGFLAGLAQRAGFAGFSALLGRWLGPQVTNYVVARTIQPHLLPLAGLAIGAVASGQVLQYFTNRYPGVVRWLNQLGGAAGVITVVLGVVYWTAWNNQGPLGAVINGVTAFVTRPTTMSTEHMVLLMSG